jgi:hypothetical protein
MGILPDGTSWNDWTGWARDTIVVPLERSVRGVAGNVEKAIFNPFTTHLGNLRFVQLAALINNPRVALRHQIRSRLPADRLRVHRITSTIRASNVDGLVGMLDDYLARLDSVELAFASLFGRKLPIIEAFSADLHTLLGRREPTAEFPSSILAMLEEVGDAFAGLLGELQVIAGGDRTPRASGLAPGHFYDWVCCRTAVDTSIATDQQRKQQQRVRHTMVKVLLTYVDGVDLSPSRFTAGAQPSRHATSFGGFALSSVGTTSALRGAGGVLRAWSGLLAAAFEHVFVSSRPLESERAGAPSDLYHDLPLTLKLQRPDLSALAFSKPGYSMFSPDMELRSEFLAMKVAMTSAEVTSTAVRTAVTSIGNGIWEISPNNPPLVDTIASLVAASVYEMEKAILYDFLRRFRVYVTDQPIDTSGQFVIARATLHVPDFSGGTGTEKQLTAVVGVACEDRVLLDAARQVFGSLPVSLDDEDGIGSKSEIAGLLHGLMKDSLAVGCVVCG